jgi:signal transduction histidine kinase
VAAPLIASEQPVGALVLAVRPGAELLTGRDLTIFTTIAGQIALAVENATLYLEVQAREALRGAMIQQIVSAQEGERQRIARELHDGTGQVLTGLGLGLKAAADTVKSNPELAARQLSELKELSAQALQELRGLVANLRPSILDDLGLVPAIHSQVEQFAARTGVDANLVTTGRRRRLSPDVETVVFRIAQEALTNVAKHAAAQHVQVRLDFNGAGLHLAVEDDGRGFSPENALTVERNGRPAWGLLGMQERVSLVGGTCAIRSRPGQGTVVTIFVPYPTEEESHVENPSHARR